MSAAHQSLALDRPYYGASPSIAFVRFWKKYATFSGRASRSEYWWWVLIWIVIEAALGVLFRLGGAGVTNATGAMTGLNGFGVFISVVISLVSLATIIPWLAVLSRRLHDANFSAWFILLVLFPGLGQLVLIIMAAMPSRELGDRFDVQR
jgi:uncharacterized membrane protein YhaH (DUF805 family)